MALKTIVKVGNISNLSDARYCAGMGVDMLGFNFKAGDPEAISINDYKGIAEWLSGVRFVGEFQDSSIDIIRDISDQLQFDAIEIDNPEICRELAVDGIPIVLKFDPHDPQGQIRTVMEYCAGSVEYFLIVVNESVSDEVKKTISALANDFPVLLGGNLSADLVLNLIDTLPVQGIALKGSKEIKPGFKDYDELADILESLEIDD